MYHVGDTVGLKTKMLTGWLTLEPDRLVIRGDLEIEIPSSALKSVELFRLHGTGRMLKVVHENGTLFVSVIRFCWFGYFAVTNFFATGRLARLLESRVQRT